MSYQDGMSAINLEMPPRVPRTEYSVENHWELLSVVTGINVDNESPVDLKITAQKEFRKMWNYDFIWNTYIHAEIFGDLRTSMGHAVYQADGVDYNDKIYCPFKEVEEVLEFDPLEAFGEKDIEKLTLDFEKNYQYRIELFFRCCKCDWHICHMHVRTY